MAGLDASPVWADILAEVPANHRENFLALLETLPEGQRAELAKHAQSMARSIRVDDFPAFAREMAALGYADFAAIVWQQFRAVYVLQ